MPPRPAIRGLSLDAGGALLHPIEPIARTYARFAGRFGGTRSETEVGLAFRAAFSRPWTGPRYVEDGRPFWRRVVADATGVTSEACFEELYSHYASPEAWRVAGGARAALEHWRRAGGRVAVTSDWDRRLGPTLDALGLSDLLDARIISAEQGHEKPSPLIFRATARALDLPAGAILHLGDSPSRDVAGARRAGMLGMLWTGDVPSLGEVVSQLLAERLPDGAG